MPTKTKSKFKKSSQISKHTGRPLPARHTSQPPVARQAVQSQFAGSAMPTGAPAPAPTMFRLGSMVTDMATGLAGMATLYQVSMDNSRQYLVQPLRLDPETGGPVQPFWSVPTRLTGDEVVPEIPLPLHILGTEVEDKTGFKGTAIDLVAFVSGCCHVSIQPKGVLEKSGDLIKARDFDILRLKGPALPTMTEAQEKQAKKERPSPFAFERSDRSIPEGV